MAGFNGNGNGAGDTATNIAFSKFLFILPHNDDDTTRTRLRLAGSLIARGFFNDFDADGTRETQPGETIQFLVAEGEPVSSSGVAAARYVVHLSANYRPRLRDVEDEFRRRLGDQAVVIAMDGALRHPRYTSAEMHEYAYKRALPRTSGRATPNAIILPLRKTDEWWQKPPLDRHTYFYPHIDAGGCPIKGHARAAEAGISTIFRRLYHNPDGYRRPDEYDFITYFECRDDHLSTFDKVCDALRDTRQNPEWRYVIEGPEWRGKRVLRW
jgi:hypothetical protein